MCVFEPHLGWLGAMYAVHLRLIGKLVVDFLLVTIELSSLGLRMDGFTIAKTALHSMQHGKKLEAAYYTFEIVTGYLLKTQSLNEMTEMTTLKNKIVLTHLVGMEDGMCSQMCLRHRLNQLPCILHCVMCTKACYSPVCSSSLAI